MLISFAMGTAGDAVVRAEHVLRIVMWTRVLVELGDRPTVGGAKSWEAGPTVGDARCELSKIFERSRSSPHGTRGKASHLLA